MNISLREYQIDSIKDIRNSYVMGFRAPLFVLPTGGGKTAIFCKIVERVAANGKRVYILVHRQEIFRQTSEHLERLGIEHGKVSPGYRLTGDKIQLCSVYTLARRYEKLPEPDLIIIDEAHHAIAKTWGKILDYWNRSRLLGVTATPLRLDGRGLGIKSGGFFDTLVEGKNIQELTRLGYLTPAITYAPPVGVDMSGVRTIAGDYDRHETASRIDKPRITGSVIDHYRRICDGLPAIAFCASIKHAEHVAEQFNDVGIPSASIDGKMNDTERKQRINALGSGIIKVLTSCEIISEGTDIPVVSVAILLRPTQSLSLYLQQCGRALRPAPQIGKKYAVVLDHVGNSLRHGFVDEIREWSLESKPRRKKKDGENLPSIRQCTKCYCVYPSSRDSCPQCGELWHTMERKIEEVAGELVTISKIDIENYRNMKKIEVGKARTYEELLTIAKQRNYNFPEAWARRLINLRRHRYGR